MIISRELARFVAELKYENIPENVIEVQKRSILDNIAIISGGADGNGCREFVEYAVESAAGGKGEATLLGQGMKLPAVWAAFANASMVMALDFSDTSATATIHPNTSTFTVCLALAEKLGGVSEVGVTEDLRAYRIAQDEPVVTHLRSALAALGWGEPALVETFGGSDNNQFVRHGLRGLVLASAMELVHTTEEYTHIPELARSAALVLQLMTMEDAK